MKTSSDDQLLKVRGKAELCELLTAYPVKVEYSSTPVSEVFDDDDLDHVAGSNFLKKGVEPKSALIIVIHLGQDADQTIQIPLNPELAFKEEVLTKHADFIESSLRAVNFVQTTSPTSEWCHATDDAGQLVPAMVCALFAAINAQNIANYQRTCEVFSYLFGYCTSALVDICTEEESKVSTTPDVIDPYIQFTLHYDGPTIH